MSLFKNIRLPVFVTDDMPRKLTALFFACLIWYFVNQHVSEVETFKNVKVDVSPGSSTQVIVSNFKPEITVSIRGPRKVLNTLESKDIQVTVNIGEKLRPGMNELRVKELDIKLPAGLSVENLATKTINVDIDNIEEKEVNVRLRYNNRLSSRFKLRQEPKAEPDRVVIKGPSRRLRNIPYVDTNAIFIDASRKSNFRITTKVNAPEGVELNYDNVTAYVELEEKLIDKTLPVQQVFPLYTGVAIAANQNIQAVGNAYAIVSGSPEAIAKLSPEKDVKLFIEIVDRRTGEFKIHFWCKDPDINLVNVTPSTITIK